MRVLAIPLLALLGACQVHCNCSDGMEDSCREVIEQVEEAAKNMNKLNHGRGI